MKAASLRPPAALLMLQVRPSIPRAAPGRQLVGPEPRGRGGGRRRKRGRMLPKWSGSGRTGAPSPPGVPRPPLHLIFIF